MTFRCQLVCVSVPLVGVSLRESFHVADCESDSLVHLPFAPDDDETLCLGPQAEGLRGRQRRFFKWHRHSRPHRAPQRHSAKTRH